LRKRLEISGECVEHLSRFEDWQVGIFKESFDVRIHLRKGKMSLQGEEERVALCEKAVQTVLDGYDKGKKYNKESLNDVCNFYLNTLSEESTGKQRVNKAKKIVENCTKGQEQYMEDMRNNVVTFAMGPAGCGKTYLAVGMAVQYLLAGKVERIVLVRPAVEAGEKLGFLPGDLNEKIKPYLLPLFDALKEFLGAIKAEHYAEKNIIEIAPLAYMRGRTLNNCFMILDEAQNTTPEQMKMFLTRIGNESRAVITGDISQIDLGKGVMSGMVHAKKVLKNLKNIVFTPLGNDDIVRHPVVASIVQAYEKVEKD
jgi:phosphate starvation-inducible protein PhoH and related proteins